MKMIPVNERILKEIFEDCESKDEKPIRKSKCSICGIDIETNTDLDICVGCY